MATFSAPLLFLFIFSTICGLNAEHVPVFMWRQSSEKTTNKLIPALDIINTAEFKGIVTDYVGQKDSKKVIFVADYLSNHDLACRTSDGVTCFSQVSQIPDKTYLPAVENPIEAFTNDTTVEVYVKSDGELSQDISNLDSKVYLITLPTRYHEEAYDAHKMRLDRIIAQISETLSKNEKNLVFIATGLKMSDKVHLRKVRDTNEQVPPNKQQPITLAESNITLHSPNLLLFSRAVFEVIKNEKAEVSIQKVDLTAINIKNSSHEFLALELTGTASDKQPLSVEIKFNNSVSYWTIDTVSVNGNEAHSSDIVAVPSNSSFKCSAGLRFSVNSTRRIGLLFKGIQIQTHFGAQTENILKFSHYSTDCVGFTSIGIWAGIFVTILLLFIVFIGLTCIMDIRTMDRFDDPKGKTITVSITE